MTGFREGWALKSPTAVTTHYFRRRGLGLAVSLCGSQDAPAGWLIENSGAGQCERCAILREKELARLEAAPPEAAEDERGDHRACDGKAGD
ncbi:MAG: hypothetical protein EOR86_11780 [Mesorhizobium sp.]|uniref:hypothetical protein n=1 Tax=Mesorhizobium sp. TaxID=1871066 RepID=UPI000FE9AA53|nr:hypothetical protein [Mesorhizobium sp.]RWM97076.1 MAG: hypothetical protein EOR86_11780 [Mesorhizobium sp.]